MCEYASLTHALGNEVNTDEVRKANLRQLAKERGSAELARALGYRHPSYISQMVGPGSNRPLSEKNARRFEQALGLGDGWFDVPHKDHAVASETSSVDLVANVIRLVGTVLQDENLKVPPARFADLVALAYADTAEHGGTPREGHIKSLVRLLK